MKIETDKRTNAYWRQQREKNATIDTIQECLEGCPPEMIEYDARAVAHQVYIAIQRNSDDTEVAS
jgi:hypothetical protein